MSRLRRLPVQSYKAWALTCSSSPNNKHITPKLKSSQLASQLLDKMTTTTTQKSSLAPDVYTEARTPLQNMEQQYSPSLTNIDAQPPPAYDSLSGATNTLTLSPSQPETNSDEKPPPSPSSFEEQSLRFNQDDPPLPSSLHRPAPPSPTYTSFPPTYLTANGKHLDEGFPMMLPPPLMQPHPFTSHDVNEAEWKQ